MLRPFRTAGSQRHDGTVVAVKGQPAASASEPLKRVYGWIGATCWVMIFPAKVARRFDPGIDPTLIGVAPSLLGPAGLLLVVLSSKSRFAHLTLAPAAAMAGTIALGLEFAQMLPLVRRIYTFDWLDVAATLIGVSAGVAISAILRRGYRVTR